MRMRIFILLSFLTSTFSYAKTLTLSREVFQTVPFSTQYSEDGALIRSVHYPSVNALIPQLNSLYKVNLEDRREAHVTIITPPEFQSSLTKVFTVNEMLNRYSSNIQALPFEVVCVGSRKSSNGQNHVFYLVVKSDELSNIRFDLAQEANLRARTQSIPLVFKPEAFWPHITIGFIKGDVFEFSKGPESCLVDVKLVIK
jgi:2'-5' RNA ligase